MAIRIVRLGTPRNAGEGTRIGTVRRPVGCYCENESRCHRSLLRELLVEAGAHVVPS